MKDLLPVVCGGFLLTALPAQALFVAEQKQHLPLPIPGTGERALLASADVDRDRDVDLVIWRAQRAYLWINDGRGIFHEQAQPLPLPAGANAGQICFGDLDADGDLDAYLGGGVYTAGVLLQNDGAGNFSDVTATRMPGSPVDARGSAFVDVDGNTTQDLVVVATVPRLFKNDGQGRLAEVLGAFPPATYYGASIAVADFDKNGAPDLLVSGDGGTRFHWLYLNDRTGKFADASLGLPPSTQYTYNIVSGDYDGDGAPDVAIAQAGVVQLWRNDGSARFTDVAATALPALPPAAQPLAFADFDGDRDLDLMIGGAQVLALENRGQGRFVTRTEVYPAGGAMAFQGFVADFDKNGVPDVAVSGGGANSSRLALVFGFPGFTFADGTAPGFPFIVTPPSGRTFQVVDADADGDVDIFANTQGSTQRNCYFVNDGLGGFTEESSTRLPPGGVDAWSAAIGDVTGDGRPDLVVIGPVTTSLQLTVHPGNSQGRFLGTPIVVTLPSAGSELELADLDHDGDLDGVAFTPQAPYLLLLINDGVGHFSAGSAGRIPPGGGIGLFTIADVDSDGHPDILTGSSLLRNDGTGRFTRTTLTIPAWVSATFADLDGDGDGDFVVATALQNGLYVLLNDGVGNFSVSNGRFPAMPGYAIRVALGDLDGDGDADAVLGMQYGSPTVETMRIFRNDGTGRFVATPPGFLPFISGFDPILRAVDLDGDGDVDIPYLAKIPAVAVLTNLSRQTAVIHVARIGGTFDLEITARPGLAPWFQIVIPCFAAATKRTALGSFGTCLLDPLSFGSLPPAYLAAPGGSLRVAVPIPGDPALRGVPIYSQAFILDPFARGGFTNAVREVLR